MSVKQDLVRSEVCEALDACIELGSWKDTVLRIDVQHAVLKHMGIDPLDAPSYGFIMPVIAEEMQLKYGVVVSQLKADNGSRRRGYRKIKLTRKGI